MKRTSVILLILALLLIGINSYADTEIIEEVPRSTLSEIPLYVGEDYIVLQDNQPDFFIWQIVSKPYLLLSRLDQLGRTGPGMACLGPETLATKPRGQIGNIRPSGWHTTRYDDLIEDKYLYNRAHVIGFFLCGDNATPENLFTGTRHLNASGMLLFETQVANYIAKTGNHVIYRCSPLYDEDNLIASGIQMEAYSVEDQGALCFNVFVFNVQPGIRIDYATGDSERELETDDSVPSRGQAEVTAEPQATGAPAVTFVLNINTRKFHRPSCPSVDEIKNKNRKDFYGTRDEVIAAGYEPCGRCRP